MATREPTPLPSTPTPQPTPTPASSAVLYLKTDGNLWRLNSAFAPEQIFSGGESGALASWSIAPDRRTAALVTARGIDRDAGQVAPMVALWLVDTASGQKQKVQELLPPREVDVQPGSADQFDLLPTLTTQQTLAWAPDSSALAFASAHEGDVELYQLARAGSPLRLTTTPALEVRPRWSPDGRAVAVISATSFGTGAGWADAGVQVAPAAGGAPLLSVASAALRNGATADVVDDLAWLTPDLLAVSWSSPLGGGSDVHIYGLADGSDSAVASGEALALAWSAGTQTLIIVDKRHGLSVWRPGEGEATQIVSDPVEQALWSPQGDVLLYSVAAGSGQAGTYVWSLGTDGDLHRVRDSAAAALAWSPDGQRLLADGVLLTRTGEEIGRLPEGFLRPVEWTEQALTFEARADKYATTSELWVWDGQAARRVDQDVERVMP
jgi:dipeptidyl aminopeptidase/acylaminoacyl peptidase